jgi:hypothetical protein
VAELEKWEEERRRRRVGGVGRKDGGDEQVEGELTTPLDAYKYSPAQIIDGQCASSVVPIEPDTM